MPTIPGTFEAVWKRQSPPISFCNLPSFSISTLRKEQAETQRKINALIDSLADFGDSTAAVHLKKRIEELNPGCRLSSRIRELENLTDSGVLGGFEFG